MIEGASESDERQIQSASKDVSQAVAEVPDILLLCETLVADGAVPPKCEAEIGALEQPIAHTAARDDRSTATRDNVSATVTTW